MPSPAVRIDLLEEIADARLLRLLDRVAAACDDESDAVETDASAPCGGEADGLLLRLAYAGADGRASERVVTVRAVRLGVDDVPVFVGMCHLRRASRAFRVDRIVSMVNARTGEVIADPACFARRFVSDGRVKPVAGGVRSSGAASVGWSGVRRGHANGPHPGCGMGRRLRITQLLSIATCATRNN